MTPEGKRKWGKATSKTLTKYNKAVNAFMEMFGVSRRKAQAYIRDVKSGKGFRHEFK